MKASKQGCARSPAPDGGDMAAANGDRSAPFDALDCVGMTSSTTAAPAKAKATRARLPKMGRHSSGQARVTLNGKVHYLGPFGSPEAHAAYADLMRRWVAGGRRPLHPLQHAGQVAVTVRDLFRHYREWIVLTGRYTKNGEPTSQQHLIETVLQPFEAFAGTLRAARLGEAVLVQWRDRLEENPKLTRRGINRKVSLLLSVLKWSRARGLLSREAWADCSAIEPLRRGECGDRREKVRPRRAVTVQEIERVAVHCCRHVAAMLRVQALLGCRPGEVCAMRWADIDRTPIVIDGVTLWTYRVPEASAKTAHHARSISYPVPPEAQEILAQFPALPATPIFSPRSSMAERGRARKTAQPFGDGWTTRAYQIAVARACQAAGIAHFSPHEVRHGAITRAAEAHGVLPAQKLANHSSSTTTARYLHVDDLAAYRVAAALSQSSG